MPRARPRNIRASNDDYRYAQQRGGGEAADGLANIFSEHAALVDTAHDITTARLKADRLGRSVRRWRWLFWGQVVAWIAGLAILDAVL